MRVTRLRGPIPEKQIDSLIARDSELRWINILEKPTLYPPMDHDHLQEVDGSLIAEDWLSGVISSAIQYKSDVYHVHPTQQIVAGYPNGLAANTIVQWLSAGWGNVNGTYVFKIVIEAGSLYPYSATGNVMLTLTKCNGANTIYSVQLMLHNGNSVNCELIASGGTQTTPNINLKLPFALPNGSSVKLFYFQLM